MSTSLILSTRLNEERNVLEINLVAPEYCTTTNLKELPQPLQGIMNNIAVAMEWLKIHGRKHDLTIIVRINDKIILTENHNQNKHN